MCILHRALRGQKGSETLFQKAPWKECGMSGQEKTRLTEDQAPCPQVSGGFSWLRGSGLGLCGPTSQIDPVGGHLGREIQLFMAEPTVKAEGGMAGRW